MDVNETESVFSNSKKTTTTVQCHFLESGGSTWVSFDSWLHKLINNARRSCSCSLRTHTGIFFFWLLWHHFFFFTIGCLWVTVGICLCIHTLTSTHFSYVHDFLYCIDKIVSIYQFSWYKEKNISSLRMHTEINTFTPHYHFNSTSFTVSPVPHRKNRLLVFLTRTSLPGVYNGHK